MKKYSLIAIVALVATLIVWQFLPLDKESEVLFVEAQKGNIRIEVGTSGELEASKSVDIMGPVAGLRSASIWQININDLVSEGQKVRKGDYVGQLDASAIEEKMSNSLSDLMKEESKYTQVQLDTTLTLREARDKLVNLKFGVEEKKIKLEQSAYEPPATIKQVKMELEKAQRDFAQSKANYIVKEEQMVAKMREATANLEKSRRRVKMYQELIANLTIKAPEDGMVRYTKDWDGKKVKSGSQISTWHAVVATLPDLSEMLSRTYVNEVDIRKVKVGQKVEVGLDAFPEKKFTGVVKSVSNVGEQKPNTDSKVFEVNVLINESDSILLPAMTTSNIILTEEVVDCTYIPLEALRNMGDSMTYVVVKDGFSYVKQEVKVGKQNDLYVVVEKGIQVGQEVVLSTMENVEEMVLSSL